MDATETPGADEEDLFDRYLEEALAGRAEDPASFLERSGGGSADLRERLGVIHRSATKAGTSNDTARARTLGRYRLVRLLGAGGMGEVHLAEDGEGRSVALKVLRAERASSPDAIERFRREAEVLARLEHPGLVRVHEAGEQDGALFLAMDFVPGEDLAERLREERARGTLAPLHDVLRWVAKAARALHAAHEAGIVHRDVKPANLRLTPDGEVVVVDFGIARDLLTPAATLTESFTGSPEYAAPEQVAGHRFKVDRRTDVYGLGAVLYECLTGHVPHEEPALARLFERILREPVAPPRELQPGLPRDLDAVVLRALEKDPSRRYATTAELADDLEAVLALRPVRARLPAWPRRSARWLRRRPRAAAVLLVGALLLGALLAVDLVRGFERRTLARRADVARKEGSERSIETARSLLSAFALRKVELASVTLEVQGLESALETRRLEPKERSVLEKYRPQLAELAREQFELTAQVLHELMNAESLDPGRTDVDAVRAELFFLYWQDATLARDAAAAAAYERLVRNYDRDGAMQPRMHAERAPSITSRPAGVDAHLFRFESLRALGGKEERLVPVPFHGDRDGQDGPAPVPHGSVGLRVVRAQGELAAEDFIVSIDGKPATDTEARAAAERGGIAASVFHDGALRDVELPAGLKIAPTAAPLLWGATSRIGVTPIDLGPIAPGEYLLLLLADGWEPRRIPFAVVPGSSLELRIDVELDPVDLVPEGFVRVTRVDDQPIDFWLMRHEVTSGEYLEFLNDPATQALLQPRKEPRLVPRNRENFMRGGSWPRRTDGRFELPANWPPTWPIVEVTWTDAAAYAEWFGRIHAIADLGLIATLPEANAYGVAASGIVGRLYPWGDEYWPDWVSSCYARPVPQLEPVGSFPIDESPFGILDLSGNASEWSNTWADDRQLSRLLLGGSWAVGDRRCFRAFSRETASPDFSDGRTGFRRWP